MGDVITRSARVRAVCVVLGAYASAIGCGDDDASPADSGPAATDSGVAPVDAGADAEMRPDIDAWTPPGIDAGPRDAGPPPACPADPWPTAIAALEDAVKAELDAHRAAGGSCDGTSFGPSAALSHDPALRRAERCHAFDMMSRDTLDGVGADGAFLAERAARAGYTGMTTGETFGVVMPDTTAAEIVDAVLAGGTTCSSALDPTTTDVGVGIAPMDVPSGASARRYFEIALGR